MTAIGITLQPQEEYLDLLGEVIRSEPDYYEVSPETLWRLNSVGQLESNDFYARFLELGQAARRPFVAHGVSCSMGTIAPDPVLRARHMARVAEDHRVFDFLWYTDHMGVSKLDGLECTLPLPLPMTDESAAAVRRSLADMQAIVPDVGVENSVFYFHFGNPLDEPAFFGRCLRMPRTHLLLDLHNVYTTARNADFDPWEYIERLPLERVIEIHLAGGAESPPQWTPSGRIFRLDSHDGEIPEEVWQLYERVLPLCANLRGVTLERMEGSVQPSDVALIREELRRARAAPWRWPVSPEFHEFLREDTPVPSPERSEALCLEAALGRIVAAPDPVAARDALCASDALDERTRDLLRSIDDDGLRLSGLFVVRLRFERIVNGSRPLREWFAQDQAGFVRTFRRYVSEVAPTATFPHEEAALFQGWWLMDAERVNENETRFAS